jgi:hypothetical protein
MPIGAQSTINAVQIAYLSLSRPVLIGIEAAKLEIQASYRSIAITCITIRPVSVRILVAAP